jgi:imidazolonepropionase-like amidohydrolase
MYRWVVVFAAVWLHTQAACAAAPVPALIRNVNVVVLPEGRLAQRRDVLVRDGRIERIGPGGRVPAPQGALIVNGHARYLMPGLAEAHAHVPGPAEKDYARDVLALYLLHGLTTIRGMLGDPWHLELREELARGEVLGPRLYTAGPSINGTSAPRPERAVLMIREQAAAGFDFLKLHPGLTLEVFDAIAATAAAANITFQGHVSDAVGVQRALAARQRAIDHLDGYVQALADPECRSAGPDPGFFGIAIAHCAQEERIPELVHLTREAGTWIVPTQILLEQWAAPPTEAILRQRPAVRFMPPSVVKQWLASREKLVQTEGVTVGRAERFIALRRSLIRQLHDAGVPLLLGSDAPQVFNVPGDSALEELRLYVEIGLTPAQALVTGTSNVARFFGAGDRFGQVREGFDADLLLLDANPLEDVSAVRRLAGIMVRGRWVPRKERDAILDRLARRMAPGTRAAVPP